MSTWPVTRFNPSRPRCKMIWLSLTPCQIESGQPSSPIRCASTTTGFFRNFTVSPGWARARWRGRPRSVITQTPRQAPDAESLHLATVPPRRTVGRGGDPQGPPRGCPQRDCRPDTLLACAGLARDRSPTRDRQGPRRARHRPRESRCATTSPCLDSPPASHAARPSSGRLPSLPPLPSLPLPHRPIETIPIEAARTEMGHLPRLLHGPARRGPPSRLTSIDLGRTRLPPPA